MQYIVYNNRKDPDKKKNKIIVANHLPISNVYSEGQGWQANILILRGKEKKKGLKDKSLLVTITNRR